MLEAAVANSEIPTCQKKSGREVEKVKSLI